MQSASITVPLPYGSQLIMTTVEASVQRGLPDFRIVGLPDRMVREALVRVKTAILASGLQFPQGRVTINISPSDVPKRGTGFDLGIALAVLAAKAGVSPCCVAYGELNLKGSIVKDDLAKLVGAYANKLGKPWLLNSSSQGKGKPVETLAQAWSTLQNLDWHDYPTRHVPSPRVTTYLFDSIKGNAYAKRALLLALAGRHHMLLSGPPGLGKTMLCQSAVELLPTLSSEMDMQISLLESQVAMQKSRSSGMPPSFTLSHRQSVSTIFGKANPLTPGLLSLASSGLVIFDELPYYSLDTLTGLLQVMESKLVSFGKTAYAQFPATAIIIATRNMCPCGKRGDAYATCACTPGQLAQYNRRLSTALLDRFPVAVEVLPEAEESNFGLSGEACMKLIAHVHEQKMTISFSEEAEKVLVQAIRTFRLAYRPQAHIRAVSETIARLAHASQVTAEHIHEAIQYRVRQV